jgi:hypothetical protein
MLVADARYYCGSGLNWREAEAEKQGRYFSRESLSYLELADAQNIGVGKLSVLQIATS